MNNRTVRLLRRYAVAKGLGPREVKRIWNRLPRTLKPVIRWQMNEEIR